MKWALVGVRPGKRPNRKVRGALIGQSIIEEFSENAGSDSEQAKSL